MRAIATLALLLMGVTSDVIAPAGWLAVAAPPVGECRPRSTGERPVPTADDVVNCVVSSTSPTRARVSVSYTYASPMGTQNIWMGIDVLAGGNRLKWFGYRPAPITSSSGTATIEIVYGQNNPPKDALTTDQIEVFMYVGGGQIFYRRLFTFRHTWQI